ncbi:MAG: indole-3-glycerol phosphate synthase TrpC [Acidimicrobiia bacterium]|nr:indole-3-glycerol phosphate synthase TrpC [Acidimicrobiia bacterium]
MLSEIIAATVRRIETGGILRTGEGPKRRGFGDALAGSGLQVIAEIKRRSPSRGDLNIGLDPAAQAQAYAAGGAAAISVLTEPDYFGGSLEDLETVRAAVTLPVLRKDFIIDPRQVGESRAAGADALLLIVAGLDPGMMKTLLAECAAVGIEALVEAHNESEARAALDAGATIVGVNNRDLHTFVTDLAVAERVASQLDSSTVRVAESGVSDAAGAARMAAAGYDAILVGEALVTASDPAQLIAELRKAAP